MIGFILFMLFFVFLFFAVMFFIGIAMGAGSGAKEFNEYYDKHYR